MRRAFETCDGVTCADCLTDDDRYACHTIYPDEIDETYTCQRCGRAILETRRTDFPSDTAGQFSHQYTEVQ